MSASISRLTIPTYLRGLRVLTNYLDKAAAHAQSNGLDPDSLVGARLAPLHPRCARGLRQVNWDSR